MRSLGMILLDLDQPAIIARRGRVECRREAVDGVLREVKAPGAVREAVVGENGKAIGEEGMLRWDGGSPVRADGSESDAVEVVIESLGDKF